MNAVADFDISQILNNLYRRKGLIVSVFVVVSLLAAYLASVLPNVYRSSALIVVTPQSVPTSFVASTVTIDLRRTDAVYYSGDSEPNSTGKDHSRIRSLSLRKGSYFRRSNQSPAQIHQDRTPAETTFLQFSFESENPEKAKQVTSRLAIVIYRPKSTGQGTASTGNQVFHQCRDGETAKGIGRARGGGKSDTRPLIVMSCRIN